MAKVTIEELDAIVLEGGGATGAVYLGAIQAIEEKLKNLLFNGETTLATIKDEDLIDVTYNQKAIDDAKKNFAIMDIVNISDGTTKINKIAGSSAGAITALALALGFNSKQIKEITDYPFENFLKTVDVGKYRMINEKGEVCIGEDKKNIVGNNKPELYHFIIDKKQKVNGNILKSTKRNFLIHIILKVIISGFIDTIDDIFKLFGKDKNVSSKSGGTLFAQSDFNGNSTINYIFSCIKSLLSNPMDIINKTKTSAGNENSSKNRLTFFTTLFWTKGVVYLLRQIFGINLPKSGMRTNIDAVGSLLADGGMFSGFEVREYFFNMMLYASVNNTHFHRSYFEPDEKKELLKFTKDFDITKSRGGEKCNFSDIPSELKKKLEDLSIITFKELFCKLKVDITFCVTNFTTDEPTYFSKYWTPDFSVLEACGASMTIPPAIRPLFNESNVIEFKNKYNKYNKNGLFDFNQFKIDQLAIKRFLSEKDEFYIDTNTNLGFSNFIPSLRKTIKDIKEKNGYKGNNTYEVNDEIVVITYEMLIFHYNSTYKGLFIDGGYKCNIPYNILREGGISGAGSLKGIVALKLDSTFPDDLLKSLYESLEKVYKGKYNRNQTESLTFLLREQKHWTKKLIHLNFTSWIKKDKKKEEINQNLNEILNSNEKLIFKKEDLDNIFESVLKLHELNTKKNQTPWNSPKSIINTALEGYSYGSSAGQIKMLSDHEHLIPMYSFGVGTFDFDLTKISGLVKLSQMKAKEQVAEYFK